MPRLLTATKNDEGGPMKKVTFAVAVAALCAAPAAAAPPTLTLKAAPTVVAYGGTATLSGVLSTTRAGQSVDVQAQECGQGAFKKVASTTTAAEGAFSTTVKPAMNSVYQVKARNATSPSVTVKVAPVVAVKKLALGKFKLAVTAGQSFVGKYVVFQRLRKTKWVSLKKVATTTAPTQVSTATFRIKLGTKIRVRAVLPLPQAGSCYLAAKSKAIRS
jgi:hypothetical protein